MPAIKYAHNRIAIIALRTISAVVKFIIPPIHSCKVITYTHLEHHLHSAGGGKGKRLQLWF